MSKNAKTGTIYTGGNEETLLIVENEMGYKHNTWATYKQWQELGFQVKKGEKGTRLKFFSNDQKNEQGEVKKKGGLKFFSVFNIAQVDKIATDEATEAETPAIIKEETEKGYVIAGIKHGEITPIVEMNHFSIKPMDF